MCSTTYRVSYIMNDGNFMNLYIYQMFSPSHWGRANLECETSCISSLVSNDLQSERFSNARFSFCELITNTWFKMDSISILTEFIPLQMVAKWFLNWNMMLKKFLSWKSAFSYFDRWWTVLFIWRMSFCNDLRRSLLVSVSAEVRYMKLNCFASDYSGYLDFLLCCNIILKALISSALFVFPNRKLNREWIMPLLVCCGFDWCGAAKILSTWLVNGMTWVCNLQVHLNII